ncbi:RagB/SusD family nutrient uptake outer membrane protein [Flavobacterium circumlabens]|uniref:Outer membrane starch-binding protein n=1 Tax=Flavobacterium circumlabens TaxID=2133765 RepID=A0A4Y7UG58_9FLAO|nr:RagB/SusD family nutrient uptake outer membrane protein [Flavobacterium circumlabens]TCN59547.1 putative outer membrane starch-binding protein [Flavobacterium circumlabens]TEB44839.1 RagB/SusD family nutrient uptake outer membrane protein [Flavobacterium circumlabens]
MILKYKTIVALLFFTATIISCDVDRLPETTVSDESFWKTENDLKSAANYFYSRFAILPVTSDIMSDDAYGSFPDAISDGSRIAGSTDDNLIYTYKYDYTTIRAANNLIEKSTIALSSGVLEQNVNWYVGEAKYFRAWSYYQLLQRYGGVPLILKTLTENSPELQAPQASREEIINAIYADLDDAVLKLRTATQLGTENYGRISQTAALTLKAQVALFEGTRAKFHGYGDPIKHLTIAKNASYQVMNSGQHRLFNNYFQLLQYEGEGFLNKENIVVKQYGKSITENTISHNSQRTLELGGSNPTKALADSYLMTDGLTITKSPLYVTPTKTAEVFINRDPRMGARFLKTGDPYITSTPVFTVPNLGFTKTGFANRSYANMADWTNSNSYIDQPVTRYAEVLLIYAESTFELNNSISDNDLNLSINLLRERVSMPKLTNAFVAANNLDMRTEIRRERRVELALEGFRYWDLIRWKTAEIELPKEVLGSFFFTEFGTSSIPLLNEENFIITQRSTTRKFNASRDYLWPFPNNEIGLNPNLKQNPNW